MFTAETPNEDMRCVQKCTLMRFIFLIILNYHKVSSLMKFRQNTKNYIKWEVYDNVEKPSSTWSTLKQYLRSFLDISANDGTYWICISILYCWQLTQHKKIAKKTTTTTTTTTKELAATFGNGGYGRLTSNNLSVNSWVFLAGKVQA